MVKITRNLPAALALYAILLTGAQPVMAQGTGQWTSPCVGPDGMSDVATIQGFTCLVANGLSVILTLFVLLGFVMVVYGGIIYMISGGQPQRLQKGVDTIKMVIIGIVVALSSFILLNIIVQFTGVESLFTINF